VFPKFTKMCTVCATAVPFVTSNPKCEQKLLKVAVRPLGACAVGDAVAVVGSLAVAVAVGDAEPVGAAGDGDPGVPVGAAADEDAEVPGVDEPLLGSAKAKPIPASQNAVTAAKNATLRPARTSQSNR
jgi:hypothetical protein